MNRSGSVVFPYIGIIYDQCNVVSVVFVAISNSESRHLFHCAPAVKLIKFLKNLSKSIFSNQAFQFVV